MSGAATPIAREAESSDSCAKSQILRAGTLVEDYVLIRELGRGGMGVVFEAHDRKTDRLVAVKFLSFAEGEFASGHAAWAKQQLIAEAKAMAAVAHPNVLPVYNVGEAFGLVFIVMELVRGVDLRTWWQARARDVAETMAVVLAAGRGLAAVHEQGLLHRDFKPQNVLVAEDGGVFVLDFGLALSARPVEPMLGVRAPASELGSGELTQSASIASRVSGTPAYMSPEQHTGRALDHRSDQYSFAVTVYEGLYGERPFNGADREMLLAAIMAPDAEIRAPDDRAPSHVLAALRRALSVLPDNRFPSLNALLDVLAHDPGALRRARWRRFAWVGSWCTALGLWVAPRVQWHDRCATDRVQAALAAVQTDSAGRRVQLPERLEQHLESWAVARGELCRMEADDMGAGLVFDGQSLCLQRNFAAATWLVERWRDDRLRFGHRIDQLAAELDDPSECLEAQPGRGVVPWPKEPGLRAAVSNLRSKLDNVERWLRAREPDEFKAQMAVTLAEARTIGYGPAIGEALYLSAFGLDWSGQRERAIEHMHEALLIGESLNYDALVIRAIAGLMEQGDVSEPAEERLRHIHGHYLRAREDSSLRLVYEFNRARTLGQLGRTAESLVAAQAALEAATEAHGIYDRRSSAALHNVATGLIELGRPRKARLHFEKAYAIDLHRLGAGHPQLVLSASNLGELEHNLGRSARALEWFSLAHEVSSAGRGHPGDPLLAAAAMHARALRDVGFLARARAVGEATLEQARHAPGDGFGVELATVVVAGISHDEKQSDRADQLMEDLRSQMIRAHGRFDPQTTSWFYLRARMALTRADRKPFERFMRLVEQVQTIETHEWWWQVDMLAQAATLALLADDARTALQLLDRGDARAAEYPDSQLPARFRWLAVRAEAERRQGNYRAALRAAEQAYEIAQIVLDPNMPQLRELATLHRQLTEEVDLMDQVGPL